MSFTDVYHIHAKVEIKIYEIILDAQRLPFMSPLLTQNTTDPISYFMHCLLRISHSAINCQVTASFHVPQKFLMY